MLSWIKDTFHRLLWFTAEACWKVQCWKFIFRALQVLFMMIAKLYVFYKPKHHIFSLKMFRTTDIFSKHLI